MREVPTLPSFTKQLKKSLLLTSSIKLYALIGVQCPLIGVLLDASQGAFFNDQSSYSVRGVPDEKCTNWHTIHYLVYNVH